ncbi:hypothetical protein DPMN_187069 [Dreissena polymorpha]|uniref:Uncharacterized protein n=1 Tax=Dreissena polymorpha TaxID=45954 RepID=A0A9D4DQU3_DREPO|nr:hypothetical protein DPMN_187069 [Dreissena polymorpha]
MSPVVYVTSSVSTSSSARVSVSTVDSRSGTWGQRAQYVDISATASANYRYARLMHVRRVSFKISLCSLHRLIMDETQLLWNLSL